MDEITHLVELLSRLRKADSRFRVFGSEQHRYRLGPKLVESELARFEFAHGIQLPEDYRRFLSEIGNGGAGPFYGLEPLGAFDRVLSQPSPFVLASNADTGFDSLSDGDEYPGVLEFCHEGCGIYSYLLVSGRDFGTVLVARERSYSTGLSFGTWYKRWLVRALLALDSERLLVPRLRVGMVRADVLAEVGGDWRERPALGGSIRYFEAENIPCQLELDERDVVVKVNPWPFITARPD